MAENQFGRVYMNVDTLVCFSMGSCGRLREPGAPFRASDIDLHQTHGGHRICMWMHGISGSGRILTLELGDIFVAWSKIFTLNALIRVKNIKQLLAIKMLNFQPNKFAIGIGFFF